VDILEDAKLGFLLDPEDTIYHFEKVQNKTEEKKRKGKRNETKPEIET